MGKGSAPNFNGRTSNKEMTILDITLAKEEDKRSYLELLLQLGRNIASR
jgi:hypothetical protein